LYWQIDQANLRQDSYDNGLEEGKRETEAKYQPIIEENRAIKQENEALRQKLREAGLDG
jgi:regulator of replication initiation timing